MRRRVLVDVRRLLVASCLAWGPVSAEEALTDLAQARLEEEATYREVDYEIFRTRYGLSEETYIAALKLAETNATLSAIYRYSRYTDGLLPRVQAGLAHTVSLPSHVQLTDGLAAKRENLENDLAEAFATSSSDSVEARDLFEWRQGLWLNRLANLSRVLVRIDKELRTADGETAEFLRSQQDMLLQEEPILGINIYSPITKNDRRPLFVFLDGLFHQVPARAFACVEFRAPGTDDCWVRDLTGWGTPQLDEARRQIVRQRKLVDRYGREAFNQLFAEREVRVSRGEEIVPVSILTEVLDEFPGGQERFLYVAHQMLELTIDEQLEERLRSEIARQLVQPVLYETIDVLTSALPAISGRNFGDYAELATLRRRVIESFPTGEQLQVRNLDAQLMDRHQKQTRVRTFTEIGFVVLVGASLYLYPPAAGPAMFRSPMLWTRLLATGGHAFTMVRRTQRQVTLAGVRAFSGVGSYEAIALAESQFRSAVLLAYLDVFLPLRFGSSMKPALNGLARSLFGFARNPWAKTKVLRVALGNGASRTIVARTFSTGRTMVGHFARQTGQGMKEFGQLISLAGRGELAAAGRFLPTMAASKAMLNAGASFLIMIPTEYMARGPDFYREVGTYRDILITILIDGALGFYTVGPTFSTLERMVAVGGTVFALSIVGQWLTSITVGGNSDPSTMAARAGGEVAYVLPLSPWKLEIADNVAGRMTAWKPGWGKPWAGGVFAGVYIINNGIGNLIYSFGTKHLFDHADPIRHDPWWPESPKIVPRPPREKTDPVRLASLKNDQ